MTDRMRSLFTPQLIITLLTIFASGLGSWYATKSDIRSISENQERLERQFKELSAKVPDGGVIEQRLAALERSVDVRAMAQMQVTIDRLKEQNGDLKTDLKLLRDFTEGRIGRMPYRSPGGGGA